MESAWLAIWVIGADDNDRMMYKLLLIFKRGEIVGLLSCDDTEDYHFLTLYPLSCL